LKKVIEYINLFYFIFNKNKLLTIFSIFTLIISQILLLISYFLPIKILLLLSVEELPENFTNYFFGLTRENIILFLMLVVFLAYGLYIFIERRNDLIISKVILSLRDEDKCSSKQQTLVYKFINTFIKVQSTLVLFLLLYILIVYLFPFIGIIIFIYLLILLIIVLNGFVNKNKFYEFSKVSSGIGFILTFVLIVIDMLYFNENNRNLLSLLFVLVLSRYIFTRSIYLMNKMLFLHLTMDSFYKDLSSGSSKQ
jgi:hypothetical protein